MKGANVSKLSKIRLSGLFQLAQKLLVMEPHTEVDPTLLLPFQGVFGITAAGLYDASTDRIHALGCPDDELDSPLRAVYATGKGLDDPPISARRLETGTRLTGAIAFKGLENSPVTADPLAALAAALLEGTRLRREAAEISRTEQMNAFRAAIFDVLGSECKNALTTILAATGGLREAGPLRAEQLEMARMVEEEASRLGNLIWRLDWIARLDQGDVTPRLDTTNLTALVAQTLDQWSRIWPDRQIRLESGDAQFTILADPELLRLAINQLLDNACKFSAPTAAVHARIDPDLAGTMAIRVWSEGKPIPVSEREHLFERSHVVQGSSDFAAGSGLGLYAARKIALAHGGKLDLDPERMRANCVAFQLALPRGDTPIES